MRRFIHGLIAMMLIVGSVSAKTYTDKTFLMPRPHGVNLAMESTTWHRQTDLIDEDKWGGTVQLTGFYDKSDNEKDLAKYFGVCNYRNGTIDDFFTVVPVWSNGTQPFHQEAGFIFHTPTGGNIITLADKLTWRPDRESYGITLDYHQKLDQLVKGLFFKIKVPLVHVKTSMDWTSSCTFCSTDKGYCNKQKLEWQAKLQGPEKSLADYLTGNVTNTDLKAKQAALKYSKIHNGESETGIADVDFIIGYNFLYKPAKHINVSIGVTIPTGTTPSGTWLWEPVVGNGGHWALGFGVDSSFRIWEHKNKSLDLKSAFNYRYLFNSTEKRTMGFNYPADLNLNLAGQKALYGRYMLGAKKNDTTTTPLANFLTRDIKITPGSQFDGIFQIAFNYNNWTFDIGYNLFAREAESASLKGNCCDTDSSCNTSACGWTNDKYYIAAADWDTSNAFVGASHGFGSEGGGTAATAIQNKDLRLDSIETPGVVTHKLYTGIGHAFNEWDYPLMFGIGGSYEFETDNDCLRVWSLWAKIGLTF